MLSFYSSQTQNIQNDFFIYLFFCLQSKCLSRFILLYIKVLFTIVCHRSEIDVSFEWDNFCSRIVLKLNQKKI